jgi:hypothetical protein
MWSSPGREAQSAWEHSTIDGSLDEEPNLADGSADPSMDELEGEGLLAFKHVEGGREEEGGERERRGGG